TLVPTGGRKSFHSRQAAWHALQPMHFDTSMSLATGVSWRAGGGTDEADRRIRSASPRLTVGFFVFGLGSSNSNAIAPSPHATGPVVASMSTRNALNSGVSALASPTNGVSELGPKPLRASPMKPQCNGIPTTWTVLPSQTSGL